MGHKYVDLNPLFESGAFWLEAFTDRGDGKTTYIAKKAFNSWVESGKTAVLCRRFDTEITENFRKDILRKIFTFCPESAKLDAKWKGTKKDGWNLLTSDGESIIFCFPLSRVKNFKSALDYSTHRNIFIDEYCPMDGVTLTDRRRNETEIILELYRTIDRDHYDNFILICGNRINRAPETDLYFGLDINYNVNSLKTYKNGTIAVLVYSDKANTETARASKLGILTEGTRYNDYLTGGMLESFKAPIYHGRKGRQIMNLYDGNKKFSLYATENGIVIDAYKENVNAFTYAIDPQRSGCFPWLRRVPIASDIISNAVAMGEIWYASRTIYDECKIVNNHIYKL